MMKIEDKRKKIKYAIEKSFDLLKSCSICPRQCRVDRFKGGIGFCRTAISPMVFSYMPHHGEEPPISGEKGSGTIFFSNCNMACVYCQNYKFSQDNNPSSLEKASGRGGTYSKDKGRGEASFEDLAGIMLGLQQEGCYNINLVTPTHIMPQILKALDIALERGLDLPIVYNTSGYELAEMINLLSGIVDIYLVDMRYSSSDLSVKYSNAPGYPKYNKLAVKEMFRQLPEAYFDKDGIMQKGLIIRHLVLPNGISGTCEIMSFIAQELSADVHISLMSQYTPYYKASSFEELSRHVTQAEYSQAKNIMDSYGLYNGWVQEGGGLESLAGVNIKPV